ncbi:MAG: UbiX family flavin prenyltransferase [Candidatus Thermoplasmatota archaeon]
MKIIIGITGASGVIYGISLLKALKKMKKKTVLIISENAKKIMEFETEYKARELEKIADRFYENKDLEADIASGSTKFFGMVIIPCSMNTLSKISAGIADNLIARVASVCLKERRKLVLVPRETPINSIQIKNMYSLSKAGAIILPAMPAFYNKPKNLEDIVNFILGRVLDALDIENELYSRWKE